MNSRIIGAGRHSDGGRALIFPSSASNIPVEMFEVATPMLVLEKEFISDSGGAGEHRRGAGVHVLCSRLPGWDLPVVASFMSHRMRVLPFGLLGGGPGTAARILVNDQELSREEFLTQSEGRSLTDDETMGTTELAGAEALATRDSDRWTRCWTMYETGWYPLPARLPTTASSSTQ